MDGLETVQNISVLTTAITAIRICPCGKRINVVIIGFHAYFKIPQSMGVIAGITLLHELCGRQSAIVLIGWGLPRHWQSPVEVASECLGHMHRVNHGFGPSRLHISECRLDTFTTKVTTV